MLDILDDAFWAVAYLAAVPVFMFFGLIIVGVVCIRNNNHLLGIRRRQKGAEMDEG
ncbi:MAG: hypothetical protein K6T91_08060 [Firmicutes bacterium]|nr:hypothetical protein [Bacillota bacterium]